MPSFSFFSDDNGVLLHATWRSKVYQSDLAHTGLAQFCSTEPRGEALGGTLSDVEHVVVCGSSPLTSLS